jgi:hypothetical protein
MSEKVIRPTLVELWRGIQEAKRKFPVGTEWQHYGGDVYEITGHGVDEETGEAEVRYVRARPLEDSRVGHCMVLVRVGDFPREYAREVEFHRIISKMEGTADWPIYAVGRREPVATKTGPRFRRVYRTESFQNVNGFEVARV